jgi:hypothetical protein
MSKSREVGEGEKCPKCRAVMKRFGHPPHWKPKPSQPYYFEYWDICARCRHIQHYECAKILVHSKSGDDQQRVDQVIAQLTPAAGGPPPWEE